MTSEPINIRVYDKNFVQRGDIGAPKFVTINQRFTSVGFSTATVGLLATDRMIPQLIVPGARLWITEADGTHVISGWVTDLRGSGPGKQALVEVDILDDASIMDEVVGWVIPTAAITAQGTAGTNWTLTSNAENVLKSAMKQNAVDRLGMPLTIATNLNRGGTVKGVLRFEPIYSKLWPTIDGCGMENAGIGVTVKQSGSGLLLDVYTPAVYPRDLTEAGGAIVDWSWTLRNPTATRVAVAGPGDGTLRSFRTIDPSLGGSEAARGAASAAREASMGRIIERFRDARDVDPGDLPTMYDRGQETLDDAAAKSGMTITLASTANFRYGKSVRVGDKVTVTTAPGVSTTAVLTEALLSWTRDAGWKVTPRVGDRTDDPDTKLTALIGKVARAVAKLQRT